MNDTMELYEEHLVELNRHLDRIMDEIKYIQNESDILSDDSKDLISELMEQYSQANTIRRCFGYRVDNYKNKLNQEG